MPIQLKLRSGQNSLQMTKFGMGKKGLIFHNLVNRLTTLKKNLYEYDIQGMHNPQVLPGYINSLKYMYLEHFLGIQ